MLARNIQTSHADIASELTGSSVSSVIDVSTVDRFQNLGDVVIRALDIEANRQAAMVAYVDDFRMMMWITLAAIPLAFIMRRNTRPAGSLPPPGE
jgi:DHA2 family multidrug resistance protein